MLLKKEKEEVKVQNVDGPSVHRQVKYKRKRGNKKRQKNNGRLPEGCSLFFRLQLWMANVPGLETSFSLPSRSIAYVLVDGDDDKVEQVEWAWASAGAIKLFILASLNPLLSRRLLIVLIRSKRTNFLVRFVLGHSPPSLQRSLTTSFPSFLDSLFLKIELVLKMSSDAGLR